MTIFDPIRSVAFGGGLAIFVLGLSEVLWTARAIWLAVKIQTKAVYVGLVFMVLWGFVLDVGARILAWSLKP